MDTYESHLAWYVNQYRALYPQSAAVLVKTRTTGLGFSNVGRSDNQAAVTPLRAILGDDDSDTTEPRLLIHALYGGGSSSLYHLYDLPPLPRHITIFDSAPGVWTYQFAFNLFTAGIKPGLVKTLLATPLGHLVGVLSWLFFGLLGVPDMPKTWATAHSDPTRNYEARRIYIYGGNAKMVSPATIDAHADEAEVKGFTVWKRELFDGSGHVAHARSDPDRYWRIVRETWVERALL
ncbi:hypothetical protein QBC43DRAFT_346910 [Cladorrhinum sp. PSN259]|nr:hypothetical protein QBC43DRAFT_346910 [Cladorrhinum sp. PSN259]